MKRRFGGWREALLAAGIGDRFCGPPTTERMKSQAGRAITDDAILAEIRRVAEQLGKRTLTGADLVKHSAIDYSVLTRRFGGVSKALSLAGITQGALGRRHSEDEVFENLATAWTFYGRAPTVSEIDKPPSKIGRHTYLHRFGGWRKALKAFVEWANSADECDPALGSEQAVPHVADRADPPKVPATSADGPGVPQPERRIAARPRAPRPAATGVKPADRREPSDRLRYKVLLRDQFRCQVCGRSPATELGCKLQVDHVVPYSKGGKTTFENLQTLCAECNLGKSNGP